MCVSPTLIGSSSSSHQQMQRLEEVKQFPSPSIETERDITGNASLTLMTELRHPGQRGKTTLGDVINDYATTEGVPLREPPHEYKGVKNRFVVWTQDHLAGYSQEAEMLLSKTDNRREPSDEVEELQSRALDFTRHQ